jgi:hypothetical protein
MHYLDTLCGPVYTHIHPVYLQLPLCETPVLEAVEAFEHLLATGLTWSTTEAFVGCLKEQRTVLDVGNPVGDPTGAWGGVPRGRGSKYTGSARKSTSFFPQHMPPPSASMLMPTLRPDSCSVTLKVACQY